MNGVGGYKVTSTIADVMYFIQPNPLPNWTCNRYCGLVIRLVMK